MFTETLSLSEIEIVRRSLQATVEGSFFPDWEFHALFGTDRETVREVYAAWPHRTVGEVDFRCAVVGSLNHLLGYPHRKEDELISYVPEGRIAIGKALDHLMPSESERHRDDVEWTEELNYIARLQ